MTRLTVIGDVILDRDLVGFVDRLCPDAPVPVVDEREVIERPGGAGMAAVLLVALMLFTRVERVFMDTV